MLTDTSPDSYNLIYRINYLSRLIPMRQSKRSMK